MIALVPALTSSTSASPIIVTDSNHADTRAGWRAFDQAGVAGDNIWFPGAIAVSSNPQSLFIDFGSVTHIDSYSISNFSDYPADYSPTSWTLYGSNNGVDYTDIESRTESWGGVVQTKQYSCPADYRHYELRITGSSHVYVAIGDMQFYASDSVVRRRGVF